MSFLAAANRPDPTRLAATIINLLRIVGRPFTLPLGISSPHSLARIGSHRGATTYFPGPGVDAQSRVAQLRTPRVLVLCFDGTGDQFDADVRQYSFMMHLLTAHS